MAAKLHEVRKYEKVEPCKDVKKEQLAACRLGVLFLWLYRAKPDSEPERERRRAEARLVARMSVAFLNDNRRILVTLVVS